MRQQWKPLVHFLPRDCWNHLCLNPSRQRRTPRAISATEHQNMRRQPFFPLGASAECWIFFLRFASQQLVCTFAIEHLIRPDADDGWFSRCSLSRDFFPEHRRAWQLGQKNWSNLIHSEKAEILFRSFLLTEFIFRERTRRATIHRAHFLFRLLSCVRKSYIVCTVYARIGKDCCSRTTPRWIISSRRIAFCHWYWWWRILLGPIQDGAVDRDLIGFDEIVFYFNSDVFKCAINLECFNVLSEEDFAHIL